MLPTPPKLLAFSVSCGLALALGLAAIVAGSAAAEPGVAMGPGPGPVRAADGHVEITLVSDAREVRAGEPFRVGVRFELSPGWHMYWKNPGQSGMATEIAWSGPAVRVGELEWPHPTRFATDDDYIVTYGYADDVLLTAVATASASGPLRAAVDVLVCEVDCIPASVTLELPVTVSASGQVVAADERVRASFAWSAAAQPVTASAAGLTIVAEIEPKAVAPGDALRVRLHATCAAPPCPAPRGTGAKTALYLERTPSITLMPTGWSARPDGGFTAVLAGSAGPDDPGQDQTLTGVLVLEAAGGADASAGNARAVSFSVPLPRARGADAPVVLAPVGAPTPDAAATIAAPSAPAGPGGLTLGMLGLAFLGGLILNLMPCVLPVLAIKAVSFANLAGETRGRVALHGAAYAGGILAALGVLAALVLILRAAGTQVGWGFQFQEPLFGALVGGLLVALAMNAFGVFHLSFPGTRAAAAVGAQSGLVRSAGEGVLTVILATPCSAPFLGTALGFALASRAPIVLLMFAALGLGLAAPLVLLSLAPGVRRLLPHPGAWMIGLERALGFALLGAALWVAWVVGRAAGTDAMAQTLGFWLALAVVVALWGAARRAGRTGRARILLIAGAAALALLGTRALDFSEPAAAPGAAVASGGILWQPYDEARIAAELEAGRPVFVDFTADWCITCKANERLVIDTDAVRAALQERRVATFRADFTRRNEAIRLALARQGKAGVPMYLVYSPARPDAPDVLPELLTSARLIEAIDDASPVTMNQRSSP